MTNSPEPLRRTAAVLGATGGIGSAVTAVLVERGWQVKAVSRSGKLPTTVADPPAGALGRVEPRAADVADAEQMKSVAAGCDYVFHAAQPAYHRWPQDFPAMTEAIIGGVAAARARLVVADNLYLYGPQDSALSESMPGAAKGKKGRLRAELADRLLSAHADGIVPVTLGRISDYYGPNGITSNGGERVFATALDGGTVRMLGRPDQPHTWSYLPDVARSLVELAEHDQAYGRAWHLPVAPPLTGHAFLALVFAAVGRPVKSASVSHGMLRMLGLFNPTMRELPEMLYQFDRPFVVDDSDFRRQIGSFENTPHEQAIATTVQWFRQRAASGASS